MRIKRALAISALAAAVSTAGLGAGANAASTECTAANFTSNGVFDQEGYLACLAAAGGGTGGTLPATGQDGLQTLGLAAGLLLIGGGLVVSAQRRRPVSLES